MATVSPPSNFTITGDMNVTLTPDSVYQLFAIVGNLQSAIGLVGLLFNTVNIFALIRLILRRHGMSPTYHLLLAMGIADFFVLFFYLIYSLTMFARRRPLLFLDLTDDHHDWTHVLMYIWYFPTNIMMLSSNWCVVATTMFRFLAVAFPMKVSNW